MQAVYDKDRLSSDDRIGDADIDIGPFLKALKMHLNGLPDDITVSKVQPSSQNCLTEESIIVWSGGKISQNMILRLRNVECGEVEVQLQSAWWYKAHGLVDVEALVAAITEEFGFFFGYFIQNFMLARLGNETVRTMLYYNELSIRVYFINCVR